MATGATQRRSRVTYRCPRCSAELEAMVDPVPTWFRCPECGRAAQPPEPILSLRGNASKDVLFIGERGDVAHLSEPLMERADSPATFAGVATALDPNPVGAEPRPLFRPAMPLPVPPASTGPPMGRIILGVLFFLSTVLFVFSALSQDGVTAAVFGIGAMVLLMLLARPSRRRL